MKEKNPYGYQGLVKNSFTTVLSAIAAGVVSWPLEMKKNFHQLGYQGSQYSVNQLIKIGPNIFRGCLPYVSYKFFGIGTQRGIQIPFSNWMSNTLGVDGTMNYIVSGTISGIVGGTTVTPIEQVKLSLLEHNRRQRELNGATMKTHSMARLIYSKFGGSGFFYGTRFTIARNCVYDPINLILLRSFQDLNMKGHYIDPNSNIANAVCNATAGVATAAIDYPLDRIKSSCSNTTFLSAFE